MTLSIRCSSLIASLIVLAFPPSVTASPQAAPDPPMEWGKVSQADLAMKSFPADTNAAAVVLCDYGETSMNNDLGLVFRHHQRIKILSQAGYEWATHAIRIYADDNIERVEDVEGTTYTLGPEGNIVVTELDPKSVFEEDYDKKYKEFRFTLPALKPGCVIEFRYSIVASNIAYIRDWTFQKSIPVLWSEYRVRMPRSMAYAAVYLGYEPFYINDRTEVSQIFTGKSASWLQDRMVWCYEYRWVLRNAPGLREEPYMTTLDDHLVKISLQLSEFAVPGGVHKMSKTWEQVVTELLEHDNFGRMIDVTKTIRRVTDRVTAGITTPEMKMTAIYDYLRSNIVWSGFERTYADQDPDELLASKKGNTAEIAFLMISMLRHAGIEADPVILSTRNHGKTHDIYPMMAQFNYTLTRARVDSQTFYLDPTDPLRPMEILPTKVLNVRGLIVKEGPLQWDAITTRVRYLHRSLATVTLNEMGEIKGTVESMDEDYGALLKRRDLRDARELEFVKKQFDADRAGLEVDSVSISGKDSLAQALRISARVASSSYAQAAGDKIYINPAILDRPYNNPFKLAVRKFPVDMAYRSSITSVSAIEIPEGWEVRELPLPRESRLWGDDAAYTRKSEVNGRTIQTISRLVFSRTEFPPSLYNRLKSFYGEVVTWQGDQIVLQRRNQPILPATKGKK